MPPDCPFTWHFAHTLGVNGTINSISIFVFLCLSLHSNYASIFKSSMIDFPSSLKLLYMHLFPEHLHEYIGTWRYSHTVGYGSFQPYRIMLKFASPSSSIRVQTQPFWFNAFSLKTNWENHHFFFVISTK